MVENEGGSEGVRREGGSEEGGSEEGGRGCTSSGLEFLASNLPSCVEDVLSSGRLLLEGGHLTQGLLNLH